MTFARIVATAALVVVVAVIGIVLTHGESAPDSGGGSASADVTATTEATTPPTQPPILRDAPALEELDGWLQADIDDLQQLRGQVVILEFWTFGCSNCKATLPYLQDIYAAYGGEGLEIVGVHAPEFEFERDPDAIAAAAERLGVTWPIALDTNKRNFHAWQEGGVAYWPRTYVIDQQGRIRFDHIGEGAYGELEATVAALLDTA